MEEDSPQPHQKFSLFISVLKGMRNASNLLFLGGYHASGLGAEGRESPVFLATSAQSEASIKLNWERKRETDRERESRSGFKCHRLLLFLLNLADFLE